MDITGAWSVRLQTHTRDDLLKVCAVLARGVGVDRVTKDCVQINIMGTVCSGKSAVVDGMTAAFADGYSPYKLRVAPLMENFAGEAMSRDIRKKFSIKGADSLVTFSRLQFVRHEDLLSRSWKRLRHRYSDASQRGLDFHTTVQRKNRKADILIRLEAEERDIVERGWTREWDIRIKSGRLKTAQMAEALQDLRDFHDNRQARIRSGARLADIAPEIHWG